MSPHVETLRQMATLGRTVIDRANVEVLDPQEIAACEAGAKALEICAELVEIESRESLRDVLVKARALMGERA